MCNVLIMEDRVISIDVYQAYLLLSCSNDVVMLHMKSLD